MLPCTVCWIWWLFKLKLCKLFYKTNLFMNKRTLNLKSKFSHNYKYKLWHISWIKFNKKIYLWPTCTLNHHYWIQTVEFKASIQILHDLSSCVINLSQLTNSSLFALPFLVLGFIICWSSRFCCSLFLISFFLSFLFFCFKFVFINATVDFLK